MPQRNDKAPPSPPVTEIPYGKNKGAIYIDDNGEKYFVPYEKSGPTLEELVEKSRKPKPPPPPPMLTERERWEKLEKEGKFHEHDISSVILWLIVAFFFLGIVAI